MESSRLNISTTTQYTNFKNISGGYQNDAISMYIHFKKVPNLPTVPLRKYLNHFNLT
jgi:hypothetical protein